MTSTAKLGRRLWVVGMAAVTFAAGCSNRMGEEGQAASPKGAGGVAVVDLDQVAKRVGQDTEMSRSIEQATSSVNDQLKTIRDRLRQDYQEEIAKLAPAPAEGEANDAAPGPNPAEAAAIKQRYDQQMAQVETQAREKLTQHRIGVVERFRNDVRPIAEKIAKSRGQGIVVTKNDAVVFAFVPQADITDEVVQQLQSRVSQASHTEDAATP